MNREEYLKRLSFLLKDLPKEEIEDAIAYYEDYFEEAGEEKEEQVIKELGSPEKIAKMIRDSVQENQASSEYTEEGYRQETYEDYQQMSRKDSQKAIQTGQQMAYEGKKKPEYHFDDLNSCLCGKLADSWYFWHCDWNCRRNFWQLCRIVVWRTWVGWRWNL